MKTQLTPTALAQIVDGKVWNGNGQERIYFNQFGYNTKKMTTKAYCYIVDGEIKVSVYVQSPNQPMSWCMKEADRVKETIIDHIQGCLEEVTA